MADDTEDDALFGQLDRLVATSKAISRRDRRLVLALESDLRAVRTALQLRSDALAQKLNMAGTCNKAATAYSRIAFLGRGIAPASTNK
jgi:hypothetical protein